MRDEQMTVNLKDDDAAFVREVAEKRGQNASADDVVASAIELLKKREADLARLRAEIQVAREDPRRHTSVEIDDHLESLFQEYNKAAAE
jgi:Arc/MetJ-type ribon-helix-helix transcriptional regulator